MNDRFTPTPAAPAPKNRTWLWWLLGGLGTLSLLCVVIAIVAIFALYQVGSRVVPTASGGPGAVAIYNPAANAQVEIRQARATAKAEGKLVLIDFGADWCPDCVVLARHMESTTVKPFLEAHYVVVRVNVGKWDANLDISKQYGEPIKQGIPAVVVVDSSDTVIASTGGGELANARTSTSEDILALLKQWAAK